MWQGQLSGREGRSGGEIEVKKESSQNHPTGERGAVTQGISKDKQPFLVQQHGANTWYQAGCGIPYHYEAGFLAQKDSMDSDMKDGIPHICKRLALAYTVAPPGLT